jgi:hypothetical protein
MEMVYTCQPYPDAEMSLVLCHAVCRAHVRPRAVGMNLHCVMNGSPDPVQTML